MGDNVDTDALLKKSLYTIKKLRKRLDVEPVVVVGMACRFPGGCDSPHSFWEFLKNGKEAATYIPAKRWDNRKYYDPTPGKKGKIYVEKANFLEGDISEFDAKFFKVSPVEAKAMDPQQRILLEVSWEALENAGINPDEIRGSKTGIFVGISSNNEYSRLPQNLSEVNQYGGTGVTSSIASGRIAYEMGFNGPAISVDTACSSSLTSTYLAMDSLLKKDCDLALVGGVSLMLSEAVMSSLCMMKALSADGKCRPFDADANGYGRGEGCGIIVLKRLSDAIRDNDYIYTQIMGGAINNDGESSGLTVPNGKAQAQLIQAALKNSSLEPKDIGYIETHGTGTPLGDPIEIDALDEVFGKERVRENPLLIGSVKGNIGHLESAAGIASLIKTILCIKNREIPALANFNKINPRININSAPFILPKNLMPWNIRDGGKRMAGVSSFGFSGTNVHIILSDYDNDDEIEPNDKNLNSILVLNSKEESGLVSLTKQYLDHFEKGEVNIGDACYTTNVCRANFKHRAVFMGDNKSDFVLGFKELINKYNENNTLYSNTTELLGSTLGSDRWGARRTLFDELQSHQVVCTQVDEMIKPKLAFVFNGTGDHTLHLENIGLLGKQFPYFNEKYNECIQKFKDYELKNNLNIISTLDNKDRARKAETVVFAGQYALLNLFKSLNIYPEIIAGERLGSFMAAYAVGTINLNTAISLVYANWGICESAHNSKWENFSAPKYRYMSVLSGETLQSKREIIDDINKQHFTDTIKYDKMLDSLYEQGYRFFIEFGEPPYMDHTKNRIKGLNDVVWLPYLRHNHTTHSFLGNLAKLICIGVNVNWKKYYEGTKNSKILLPNYQFERTKYWLSPIDKQPDEAGFINRVSSDGLKEQEISLPYKQKQYIFTFTYQNLPELKDNSGVVHIGYYIELLKKVIEKYHNDNSYIIKNMKFNSPLIVFEGEIKKLLLVIESIGSGGYSFKFYSKNSDEVIWNLNVDGMTDSSVAYETSILSIKDIKNACTTSDSGEEFYLPLEKERGFYFGDSVRWVKKVWSNENTLMVEFRNCTEVETRREYQLGFHPGILDSCAQSCNFMALKQSTNGKKYMVTSLDEMLFTSYATSDKFYGLMNLDNYDLSKEEINASISIINDIGEPVFTARRISLKEFDEDKLGMINQAMHSKAMAAEGVDSGFLLSYSQAVAEHKTKLLTSYLRNLLAKVLGMREEEVDINAQMTEFGLDSMSGVQFYNRIVELLGIEISFSDVIQSKTINKMAEFISDFLPGGSSSNRKRKDQLKEIDADLSIPHWIYNFQKKPDAKVRLFCFPNGYRDADMYEDWQEKLGSEIDVCPVMLSGMDSHRFNEKAPEDIDYFMEIFEKVIEPDLLDIPSASFGHSWGALFSYRLACRLFNNKNTNFVKMFVSGFTTPKIQNSSISKVLNELKLQGFNSIPRYEDIKFNASILDIVVKAYSKAWDYEEDVTRATIPSLLAACRLIERYKYVPNDFFNVPTVGFHGVDDYAVTFEEMQEWQDVTRGSFKIYTMAGDHQFVTKYQSEAQLLETIGIELNKTIANLENKI